LLASNRLVWKGLPGTNVLAYLTSCPENMFDKIDCCGQNCEIFFVTEAARK
jgi:hypothetical protein